MSKKSLNTKISDADPDAIPTSPADGTEPEGDDWETKGHLDTLMSAHKIINDPQKMAKVNALAGRHKGVLEHLTKIAPIASDPANQPVKSLQDLKMRAKKFGTPAT